MALTAKKVYAILKRQISDMEAKLNSPVRYRGTVATADLLPLNPDIGDMYNIESKSIYGEAGMNVAWNGVVWDTMGAPIDMSLYFTKEEAEAVIQRLVTEYFEKNPVKPGATTEQAQQIEQNKTDIASLKTETSSLKEDVSNKITKFYASNQGETHLTDSDNGKIQDMMIYGRSSQSTTTGKNLLKYPYITADGMSQGIIFTDNKDGSISVSGTATGVACYNLYSNIDGKCLTLASGTYKLVVKGRSKCNVIASNSISTATNEGTFTITDGHNEIYCYITVQEGLTVDETIYPMIQLASITDESYEPYTGGIPSPSPDYPQEIKSVVNPTIKICGKNLFDSKKFPIILSRGVDTDTGDIYQTTSGKYCATEKYIPFPYGGKKISFNASMSLCAYDKDYKFISTINKYNHQTPSGTIYVRFDIRIEDKDKAQIELSENTTTYEPYKEQTIQLPITLNAIPVTQGGNVTINGQQYISDYVDVERGKIVKCVEKYRISSGLKWMYEPSENDRFGVYGLNININPNFGGNTLFTHYQNKPNGTGGFIAPGNIRLHNFQGFTDVTNFKEWLDKNESYAYFVKNTLEEIDLTIEEIQIFKALSTYYPVTNISVNSEQLDGYTVFNYPISMANGWNYVKQQLNDNRDYIYDMDLQSAEAYVNSEYAVALTELEV